MLILIGALLVSYVFPLATYFFLKSAHKEDLDYRKDCRKLLLNGLLLGFPVFGFSLLCNLLFSLTHIGDLYPFVKVLFQAFIVKALSEELMKYLLARKLINRRRAEISFLDVMAYTAISAIGFEIMEGFFYIFSTDVPQILVRGVTNMHAVFGLIMGYVLAKGYKKGRRKPAIPAVLASTLIHGIYDLCLHETIIDTPWGAVSLLLAFLCLVLSIYNFFFMKKARRDPYYTDPLFPETDAGTY